MKSSKSLAETLTRLMEERCITAKELAEKSQVSRSTIGGWRIGTQPHDLHDLRRVAHALGCTFEYLVFGEDDQDLGRLLTGATAEVFMEGIYRIKMERIVVEGSMNDNR